MLGNSGCRGSAWRAESSVLCRISPGVGKGLSMIVSVLSGRGSVSTAFSYDAFAGSSVSPVNAPSTGGVRLSVTGSGLGTALYSATVQVGRSAGVGMVWRSDSCITAKAPPGTGGRGAVSSSVSSGSGSFSWALSYNVAVVTSTTPVRVQGSGSRDVVVRGLG